MKRHVDGFTIYAVDFDGTLCTHKFPGIGEPNWKLIKWLIAKREAGDKIILWTNRMGEALDEAIEWSNEKGLYYDAVNENIPEVMERYKHILKGRKASPKITADVFIDDAACNIGLPFGDARCPLDDCWEEGCDRRTSFEINEIDRLSVDMLVKRILNLRDEFGEETFNQALYDLGWGKGD